MYINIYAYIIIIDYSLKKATAERLVRRFMWKKFNRQDKRYTNNNQIKKHKTFYNSKQNILIINAIKNTYTHRTYHLWWHNVILYRKPKIGSSNVVPTNT